MIEATSALIEETSALIEETAALIEETAALIEETAALNVAIGWLKTMAYHCQFQLVTCILRGSHDSCLCPVLQGKINVAFKMNIQINLTTFEVEHVMNFFL